MYNFDSTDKLKGKTQITTIRKGISNSTTDPCFPRLQAYNEGIVQTPCKCLSTGTYILKNNKVT